MEEIREKEWGKVRVKKRGLSEILSERAKKKFFEVPEKEKEEREEFLKRVREWKK